MTVRERAPAARLLLALSMTLGCAEPTSGESIKVGVMLTYTGDASSIGFNLERGLLLAEHRLRDARADALPFELVYRDAQGDASRAAQMADELIAEGVVAVVGPGSDEVAGAAVPRFDAAGVLVVSAVATTAETDQPIDAPWIRMAPSVEVLGANLATTIEREGVRRVGVVRETDTYHRGFAAAFIEQFEGLGGEVVSEMVVDEATASFRAEVGAIQASAGDVEGYVVALDPLPASRLISEVVAVADEVPAWFLTPRLKSAVFLLNTPTEGVEGAIGVSPDVFIVDSAGFAEAFSAEWGGDQPFETTYTMFDAGALLLLSIDAAARRDEPLDRAHIEERLFDIARPGGVQLGWQELDQAVGWNRDGATIQYTGVTGPILLDADGQRRGGRTLVWTIQGGQIVNR